MIPALALFLLAPLPAGLVRAQEPDPAPAPAAPSEPVRVPSWRDDPFAWLFGTAPRPAPTTLPRALVTRVSARQVYDSRTPTDSGEEAPGTYTLLEPELRLVRVDPLNQWALDYRLEARLYPRFPQNNSLGHDVELRWERRLSDRLNLSVRSDYQSHPGGAIEQLAFRPGLSSPGGAAGDSGFLFHKQINREIALTLDYRLSSRVRLQAGGRFSSRSLAQLPLPRARTADAFVLAPWRLSPEHTLGAAYQLQRFDYGAPVGHTLVHSPLLLYAYRFHPTVTLTIFAGPAGLQQAERPLSSPFSPSTSLPEPLEPKALWRWTGGAALTKSVGRTSLHARGAQFLGSGDGLLATVRRRTAELGLARDFTRHLRLGLQAEWSDNRALDTDRQFRSAALQPQLRYRFTRGWALVAEPRLGRLWGLEGARRSRVSWSAGVEYEFPARPL